MTHETPHCPECGNRVHDVDRAYRDGLRLAEEQVRGDLAAARSITAWSRRWKAAAKVARARCDESILVAYQGWHAHKHKLRRRIVDLKKSCNEMTRDRNYWREEATAPCRAQSRYRWWHGPKRPSAASAMSALIDVANAAQRVVDEHELNGDADDVEEGIVTLSRVLERLRDLRAEEVKKI